MSDKLSRAKHTREAVERELLQLPDTTGSFHRIGELGFEIDEADYDPYAGRHAKRASARASICTTRPCARRSPSAFPPSSSC